VPLTPASSREIGTSLITDGAVTAAKLATGIGVLDELFDSTLGADAASIDTGAGGIAQTNDHLLILVLARTTQVAVQSSFTALVNADGGANYDRQELQGANVTASAAVALGEASVFMSCPGASAEAGAVGVCRIEIPGYRQTTFHKVGVVLNAYNEDTAAENRVQSKSVRWKSTAAITRFSITAGSGNLLAGSRLAIYGIGR